MNLEQLLDKKFSFLASSLVYNHCKEVTTSDTDLLPKEGFLLVLTTAGNIKVQTAGGDIVTIPYPKGELLPIKVKRVFNTDTDAVGIYLVY